MMKTLSIIIPVYNEALMIDAFMDRLEKIFVSDQISWEAVFVDDGSCDDTWQKLTNHYERRDNLTIVSLSRNFGKDTAIFAGLEQASGQAAVVIDADLQDPPEIILEMISKWQEGYEVILGLRRKRRGESLLRRFSSMFFYKIIQAMSDCDLPPDAGDFCLLDRRVVDEVNKFGERTRYFKGLISWVGFKRTTVSYCREPRQAGQSKWNYPQLVLFALDALTSYSRLPLRIWTFIGFGATLTGALYGLYVILFTLTLGGNVPGYASLVIIILFLGGMQLLSIGVISEYIGHLFIEVKQRPLFITREIKNSRNPDLSAQNNGD